MPEADLLLAVDQGSTSTKVLVVDRHGESDRGSDGGGSWIEAVAFAVAAAIAVEAARLRAEYGWR